MSDPGASRRNVVGRGLWLQLPAFLALLAAILLMLFLAFRLVDRSAPSVNQKSNADPVNTKPVTTVLQTTPSPPSTNIIPPPLPEGASIKLTLHEAQDKPLGVNAFLLHAGKHYVVTTASCMSQSDWEKVKRIQLASSSSLRFGELQGPPQHLGDHTSDRPLNMLENPDMGKDLAVWQLPTSIKLPGISLAEKSSQGQLVWLGGDPMKKPHQLYRCQIISINDNMMYLQPLERFGFEELVGLPFIDQQGKVVGILAGGGEFTLVSMSLPAMRRQLERWQIIDKQK